MRRLRPSAFLPARHPIGPPLSDVFTDWLSIKAVNKHPKLTFQRVVAFGGREEPRVMEGGAAGPMPAVSTYSPGSDMIEQVFAELKHRLRKAKVRDRE